MAKDRTTPEAAARSFGVGRIARHLFVCTGPDCAPAEEAARTWEYVKDRLKVLGLSGAGGSVYRTKCQCLRICVDGPIGIVYPEGTWYRRLTPENVERVLQQHLVDGKPVEDLVFATNPLPPTSNEPDTIDG